jgi:hypothetical protein
MLHSSDHRILAWSIFVPDAAGAEPRVTKPSESVRREFWRIFLVINVQGDYPIKETWIYKAHSNVRSHQVARFYKENIVTEVWNERRGSRKERNV